jgi:hypothetical protein
MTNNSSFSHFELQLVGLSTVAGGCISFLSTIAMLLMIIILKKYITSTQRVLLYLNIAIIFHSISFIVRGSGYSLVGKNLFCKFSGYFNQTTGGCILVSICVIILEIFIAAVLNKKTGKLEWFYLVAIFIASPILSAIPFISRSYGQSGPWCWIKGQMQRIEDDDNDENKRTDNIINIVLQFTFYYGFMLIVIVSGVIVYIASIVSLKKRLKWHQERYSSNMVVLQQKALLSSIKHLRLYPIVYFVINFILLVVRIILTIKFRDEEEENLIGLWMFSGILQALQGSILAFTFAILPSNRGKCQYKYFKSCCLKIHYWCRDKENIPLIRTRVPTANSDESSSQSIDGQSLLDKSIEKNSLNFYEREF